MQVEFPRVITIQVELPSKKASISQAEKEVEASVSKAEQIFLSTKLRTQESKREVINELGKAYRQILILQKDEALLASESGNSSLNKSMTLLFYLFGRCLYGIDMNGTRKCLELSLAIRLVGEKVLASLPKLPEVELEALPQNLQEKELEEIDNWLMNCPQKEVVEVACRGVPEASFQFASSLRWLGHAFQNISKYNNSPDFLPRFKKIYKTTEDILKTIQENNSNWEKDCNWEIAQLLYNTTRFIHKLEFPNDIEGRLKTLDKVLPYLEKEGSSLRAKELEAQIYNIQAIGADTRKVDGQKKLEILKMQYSNVKAAVSIANEYEDFDPFLKNLFTNNLIGFAVRCLKAGLLEIETTKEEISKLKETLVSYIEKEQGNHYYYADYYLNFAKIEVYNRNLLEAIRMLNLGLEIVTKSPASSVDSTKRITLMLSRIMAKAKEEEKEEVYQLAFSTVDSILKIVEGNKDFDPFLKILLLNSRLECGYKCLQAGYDVVPVETLEDWKKNILNYIHEKNYNNDFFALIMLNLAKYELSRQNPMEAMERLKETLTITMKFPNTEISQGTALEVKKMIPIVMNAINFRLNRMQGTK